LLTLLLLLLAFVSLPFGPGDSLLLDVRLVLLLALLLGLLDLAALDSDLG
jgi:hypothetical protein